MEELIDFCRAGGLAGFKIPRVIVLQNEALPLNSSGKVMKQQVQQLLLQATHPSPLPSRL